MKRKKSYIVPIEADYDPSRLVKLAKQQFPKDLELLAGLRGAVRTVGVCPDCGDFHPYFVDPVSCKWQFARSVELRQTRNAIVIIDMMQDGRVGAIEDDRAWKYIAARADGKSASAPPESRSGSLKEDRRNRKGGRKAGA